MVRYVIATVVTAFGFLGLLALRDATLSTHQVVSPDSRIELVLRVDTHGNEPGQTRFEATEALVLACRLEVKSDVVGPAEAIGDHRFRVILQPSMDETDRRQLRGCVEDWGVDQVRADVIRLADP